MLPSRSSWHHPSCFYIEAHLIFSLELPESRDGSCTAGSHENECIFTMRGGYFHSQTLALLTTQHASLQFFSRSVVFKTPNSPKRDLFSRRSPWFTF